jgi:hypothetical protein
MHLVTATTVAVEEQIQEGPLNFLLVLELLISIVEAVGYWLVMKQGLLRSF